MKIPRPLVAVAIAIAALGLLALALPLILNAMGLNPKYSGQKYEAPGKRALVITTSNAFLGEGGKATGVYASEMTVPYYAFLDGGMAVDIASMKGGKIPIEPMSLRWPLLAAEDKRFRSDADLRRKVEASLKIDDLDFAKYDAIFLAGGWGAAYDLGYSEVLGMKVTEANAAHAALGSVCHGALGFLLAKDMKGEPLVKGRKMTAVTDKQVKELRITVTPEHPERELRKAGALYESSTAFKDIFASHVVVDGNLITGQNQNDGAQVAQLMMKFVSANRSR